MLKVTVIKRKDYDRYLELICFSFSVFQNFKLGFHNLQPQMNSHNLEIRKLWGNRLKLNYQLGVFLILLVCIPRFLLVLRANALSDYGQIGLIMIISGVIPFILFNSQGLNIIGVRKPKNYHLLFLALVIGLIFSLWLFYLGNILYGNSYSNWYFYIGKSYQIPDAILAKEKRILFLITAGVGMTFSPIGEELFFRGIVNKCFRNSVGEVWAIVIDSLSFAITHIAHFGIVYKNGTWDFYSIPTLIWVFNLFLLCILFSIMKKKTNSLLGAILCHAGFNLGMIYCIFYLL